MKTPDEIKKGLRCCFRGDLERNCGDCPYANYYTYCTYLVGYDAAAYIGQLENQLGGANNMVNDEIAPLEEEEDERG